MAAVRQRNDVGRIFLRRLGLFGLFVIVVLGMWSVWGAWRKERESSALKVQAQAAAADLAEQQTQLQGEIARLESDRGREEALRDQYAVGKQGEDLIVIVDPAVPTTSPQESSFMDRIKNALRWW